MSKKKTSFLQQGHLLRLRKVECRQEHLEETLDGVTLDIIGEMLQDPQ